MCVCVQVKKGGGMSINSTLTLTNMSEKLVSLILHEYSIQLHVYEEDGVGVGWSPWRLREGSMCANGRGVVGREGERQYFFSC